MVDSARRTIRSSVPWSSSTLSLDILVKHDTAAPGIQGGGGWSGCSAHARLVENAPSIDPGAAILECPIAKRTSGAGGAAPAAHANRHGGAILRADRRWSEC